MTETIQAHSQKSALDPKVELFQFDLTLFDAGVRHFVADIQRSRQPVSFGGVEYLPMPIHSEGWQMTGKGSLPRPTLTVSNLTGLFSALNILYGDLRGTKVTRLRTFEWALDGKPTADPEAVQHPIDRYYIARLAEQNDVTCQYELAAKLDLSGRRFPSWTMTQNFCGHTYRIWDPETSSFDYSRASCPYTGEVCRSRTGQPVSPAQDACAKVLGECVARFGIGSDLPFLGFPGIDRVRLS